MKSFVLIGMGMTLAMSDRTKKEELKNPFLSIIIPVRNGEGLLPGLLDSIFRSAWKDFECIVVDDASTDSTKDILRKYPVKTVCVQKNEGPAAARNRGARKATGEYLLFIDADVILSKDTILTFAQAIVDNPTVAGTSTYCNPMPLNDGLIARFAAHFEHYYFSKFMDGEKEKSIPGLTTRCGAIKRDIFLKLGGMNASLFSTPSAEDGEFAYRMKEAGIETLLLNSSLVEHRWPNSLLKLYKRYFRNARIFMAILRIHKKFSNFWISQWEGMTRLGTFISICMLTASPLNPFLLIPVAVYGVVHVLYNRKLYLYFLRLGGPLFLAQAVIIHILSSIPILLGAAYGMFLYWSKNPEEIRGL